MIKIKKMRLIKIGLFVVFTLTTCCVNKKEENTNTYKKNNSENMLANNDKIKSVLIKQVEAGNDEVYGGFQDYDKSDLDALIIVAESILKSNGYKNPDNNKFNNIVKKVFVRIIDNHSTNEYLKIEINDNKCDKSLRYYPYTADAQYLYVVKGKFVTNFYPLPKIIDYLKLFPDVAKFEKEDILIEDKIENIQTRASQWKDDLKYLSETRENNIQTLVNRNKYLFNDSKASLIWLKFHDEYFLESLVKIFGYVEDKDLLKWVLNRNLNDDEFDKILFTKTCDNKFIFHKEVFEVMLNADANDKKKYLMFLSGHRPKIEESNFSSETKINALYCYYSTKLSESLDSSFYYSFFPRLDDEKFQEEFKKNNYYNLLDFKKLYENARYGGIGLPE